MRFKKSNPILTAICTLAIAFSLVFSVTSVTAQSSKEKIRLLSAALRAHDAGDLEAAKTNLESLIKIAPDDPNVQKLLKAVNEDLARQGAATVATPGAPVPAAPGAAPFAPSAPSAPSAPRPLAPSAPGAPSAPSAPMAPSMGGGSSEDKMAKMSAAIQARDSGDLKTAQRLLQELANEYPDDQNIRRMLDEVSRRLAASGDASGTATTQIQRAGSAPSAPGVGNQAPAQQAPTSGNADQLLKEEYMRQRDAIRDAANGVRDARDLVRVGRFDEALNMLEAIEEKLPFSTATMSVLDDIQQEKIAIALAKARETRLEADRKLASKYLDEYKEMFGDTSKTRYLEEEVQAIVQNPYLRNPSEVSPKWVKDQADIKELLIKARSQFLIGDYQGTQRTLKDVEVRDPDNTEGKALQTRLAKVLNEKGEHDYRKTRAQMLEEVNRSWQRPQVFDIKVEDKPVVLEGREILKKLDGIQIPRVSFSDVPLSRVIETLSELSVQYDNITAEGGAKGVNMILFDPAKLDPRVTITLRNFSLEKILEFVTKSVNFQYDVKSDAVVVQQGGDQTGLDTQFYALSRATVIRMIGVRDEGSSGGGGGGNPFAPAGGGGGGGGGNSTSTEEEGIRNFLERAGVNFSSTVGSSLAFDGTQIIVTQTPRNHERIGIILRRYDETKQVEIEAKFMEVTENALEELGFNWNFQNRNDTGKFLQSNNPANVRNLQNFSVSQSTRQGQIVTPARIDTVVTNGVSNTITTPASTQTIPNAPPVFPGVINLATGSAAAAGWSTIMGDWAASVTIRALEQHNGTDLMTAPRITVLAGKPASIVVAQRLMYPTEYGDVEAEVSSSTSGTTGGSGGGGSSVAITPGTPQRFETENVGVTLEVTPNVENDNSITLKLNPRVSEFEGFVEYGGSAVAIAGGTTVEVPSGFFLPIFSIRELSTEVTIFDGATVVLGGLTRDEVKTIDDQVPILGDMPLFGRFFKSKGETRQKRNLLIFVSANLVSPGGSPARQSSNNLSANSLFQNPVIISPGGAVSRTAQEKTAE